MGQTLDKLSAVIEQDADGWYGYCPELDGCQTQGGSFEEVLAHLKEAAALYLETLTPEERRERLSRAIVTTTLEVQPA